MENQKIVNLLKEASDYRFLKKKWNIVNDQSSSNYDSENEIIYNTTALKSNLCDYNDTYFLAGSNITVAENIAAVGAFKSDAPFTKSITNIDAATVDDNEDLDLIMLIYNFIEYSSNWSRTSGRLWLYSKDKANSNKAIEANNNFKSFKYKTKLILFRMRFSGMGDIVAKRLLLSKMIIHILQLWNLTPIDSDK